MSFKEFKVSAYGRANKKERNINNTLLVAAVAAESSRIDFRSNEPFESRVLEKLFDNGWAWAENFTFSQMKAKGLLNKKLLKVSDVQTDTRFAIVNREEGRLIIVDGTSALLVSLFDCQSKRLINKRYRNELAIYDFAESNSLWKRDNFIGTQQHSFSSFFSEVFGFEVNDHFTIEEFLRVGTYFGNSMEELLRFNAAQKKPWLFRIFSEGLLFNPKPGEFKSLKNLLNVNKNDLKNFLEQPTEAPLLFYLAARQKNGMSVKEASVAYNRIQKIVSKYQLENEYKSYEQKPFKIYGPKGRRILLSTSAMPKVLSLYSLKRLNKVISINKYLRYIIDERKKNPDITLSELEKLLADYNSMSHEILDTKGFILPYNIQGSHDTMVTNYNAVKREGGTEIDSAENIKKLCVNYNDDFNQYSTDKYFVRRPVLPSDIHKEGIELNHCVGTYTNSVLSGRTQIYFVRKKSAPDKSLVTIEVRDGRILQQRGKANRMTTTEENQFIREWFADYSQREREWKLSGMKRKEIMTEDIQNLIQLLSEKQKKQQQKAQAALQNITFVQEATAAAL